MANSHATQYVSLNVASTFRMFMFRSFRSCGCANARDYRKEMGRLCLG